MIFLPNESCPQCWSLFLFAHEICNVEHFLQCEICSIHNGILIVLGNSFPMNVAEFIVTAMNILQIIKCSSPSLATLDIPLCLFRSCSFNFTNSVASLPMTKIRGNLLHHIPKFSQVSSIDRVLHLHFSTLEKTQINHNPLVNNLILTFPQVSPIDRHLQQIFQDVDIHTWSSPGLMKLKKTRTKAFLRSNSS